MTKIEIPALDGRSPLGFLAALGLVRTLGMADISPLRLSFSRDSASAELHSPLASVDDAVARLQDLISQDPDAAVVGLDRRFPFPAGQRGGDPMKQQREDFRKLLAAVQAIDIRAASEWMPSLFTDLAVDAQGRADLTPFCAPSGKQNLRTFFNNSLTDVRDDPRRLREALTGWRRLDGSSGEYIDHRVINSAADDPGGRSVERGVPGATWLATMAIPLLRVTGDGTRADSTLWYRVGRRQVMLWPLWDKPLDSYAIQALIEHPCLAPMGQELAVKSTEWPALGIFAVYGAERQRISGRKFAGVLAPCAVTVEAA